MLLLILLSLKSFGQGSVQMPKRTAQVEAVLDSAYRYELLKPVLYHLKSAYESQSKEVLYKDRAIRMLEDQKAVQQQNFDKQLADLKAKYKGRWWKGFRVGAGVGLIVTTIAISAIK